ncbi:hypothetical protein LIER_18601 [Lithospermum erythrorhizon]|uniref:Uncharacterized protein n=1 Tax=Lithospermum erythrorhizon TaxID=34254 RepID=A0AAV3QHE2_LITER
MNTFTFPSATTTSAFVFYTQHMIQIRNQKKTIQVRTFHWLVVEVEDGGNWRDHAVKFDKEKIDESDDDDDVSQFNKGNS